MGVKRYDNPMDGEFVMAQAGPAKPISLGGTRLIEDEVLAKAWGVHPSDIRKFMMHMGVKGVGIKGGTRTRVKWHYHPYAVERALLTYAGCDDADFERIREYHLNLERELVVKKLREMLKADKS